MRTYPKPIAPRVLHGKNCVNNAGRFCFRTGAKMIDDAPSVYRPETDGAPPSWVTAAIARGAPLVAASGGLNFAAEFSGYLFDWRRRDPYQEDWELVEIDAAR